VRSRTAVTVSLWLAVACSSRVAAAQTRAVAVLPVLDPSAILAAPERDQLARHLVARLVAAGRSVVPEAQLARAWAQRAPAEVGGGEGRSCQGLACRLDVGRRASADQVLALSLARTGTACTLTVELTEVALGTFRTESAWSSCAVGGFVQAFDQLVPRLGEAAPAAWFPARVPARPRPTSPGRVVAYAFGGLGLATGTALLSVGIGVEKKGFVYGGIPTLSVGAALIIVGLATTPAGQPLLSRDGSALCWVFGGLSMVTGGVLLGVGKGVHNDPLAHSGIPPLVVGSVLVLLGIIGGIQREASPVAHTPRWALLPGPTSLQLAAEF
jgi:hypothetical protein